MKRFLLFVAITTAITGNLSGSPDQSAAAHKQDVVKQEPRDTTPVTVIVENSPRSEPAQSTAPQPPQGDTTAEWVLVFVGIVTAGFIGWQSWETRRSAKAMQKSIDLQEVGLRQWVTIKNWRSEAQHSPDGTARLNIEADIVNPTGMPLTLQAFTIRIGTHRTDIGEKHFLAPQEPYIITATIPLTAEQVTLRSAARLILAVVGSVAYEDALNKWREQPFSGWLACSKTHALFTPMNLPEGFNPEDGREQQENEQKGN